MPKGKRIKTRIGKLTIVREATGKITRNKREKVSEQLVLKIRELAGAGHSKTQIARALKLGRSTVQDYTRDIKAPVKVRRARADLVETIMDRFKDFYSCMIRLAVPPRHLSVLAKWIRKKAGLEDDAVLDQLVDDHLSFLKWFVEALDYDTNFTETHPHFRGIQISSGDYGTEMTKRLANGNLLRVTMERSDFPALPEAPNVDGLEKED